MEDNEWHSCKLQECQICHNLGRQLKPIPTKSNVVHLLLMPSIWPWGLHSTCNNQKRKFNLIWTLCSLKSGSKSQIILPITIAWIWKVFALRLLWKYFPFFLPFPSTPPTHICPCVKFISFIWGISRQRSVSTTGSWKNFFKRNTGKCHGILWINGILWKIRHHLN